MAGAPLRSRGRSPAPVPMGSLLAWPAVTQPPPYPPPGSQFPPGAQPAPGVQFPPGSQPPLPYAPPVAPPGTPAGYPPGKPGTNGFAIASLILGLVGGILLSVVFGIVALVQIGRSGQRGKGLAVAGLCLSGVWVLGLAGLIVVGIASSADRDASGEITDAGTVSVQSLEPGDCVNGLKEGKEVLSLPALPCTDPHEAEVFARFELTESTWPGDEAVFAQAEQGCQDRIAGYSPTAADDESLELIYLHPTQTSWRRGDHAVICFAVDPTGKRTGSLRG